MKVKDRASIISSFPTPPTASSLAAVAMMYSQRQPSSATSYSRGGGRNSSSSTHSLRNRSRVCIVAAVLLISVTLASIYMVIVNSGQVKVNDAHDHRSSSLVASLRSRRISSLSSSSAVESSSGVDSILAPVYVAPYSPWSAIRQQKHLASALDSFVSIVAYPTAADAALPSSSASVHPTQQHQRTHRTSLLSLSLVCVAVNPSKEQPSLYDYAFYKRFHHNPPRTNLALLTKEARFVPELSSSPLIAEYANEAASQPQQQQQQQEDNNNGGETVAAPPPPQQQQVAPLSLVESSAAEWLQAVISASPCHSLDGRNRRRRPVILVTKCRDQPKRAWEHVAYHTLIGVDRIIMLDISSNVRPAVPPLDVYLRPWTRVTANPLPAAAAASSRDDSPRADGGAAADAGGGGGRGILEIVPSYRYLGGVAAADGGGGDVNNNKIFVDVEDAALATALFFADVRKRLQVSHPDALVLCLEDVNDYFLITAASTAARKSSTATTAAAGSANSSSHHHEQLCVADIFDDIVAAAAPSTTTPTHDDKQQLQQQPSPVTPTVTFPKALVATEALYDNSRTPFEFAQFAAGESLRMMDDMLHYIRKSSATAPPSSTKVASSSPLGSVVESIGILSVASRLPAAVGGGAASVHDIVLPDGTRWSKILEPGDASGGQQHAPSAKLSSLSEAALKARVIRIAETQQAAMERHIDHCYRSPKTAANMKSIASSTLSEFDSSRVHPVKPASLEGSLTDDLPIPNSLKRNGFLTTHRLLLKLMKYPTDGRRERTFALQNGGMAIGVVPQIQNMLARFVAYGGTSNGGGDQQSAPSAHEITNENLVSGVVRLVPEELLITSLNTTHLDRVLTNLFGFSSFGGGGREMKAATTAAAAAGKTVCPSLRPGGAQHQSSASSNPHQRNVTFCVVVRNRAKLTVEWVLYHKLLGVGRFLVVDDGSTDSLRRDLAPLVQRGIVEMIEADDGSGIYRFRDHVVKGPLLAGYGTCIDRELRRAAVERHAAATWVGLVDSDEFLVLPTGECIPELVARVLATRSSHAKTVVGAIAFSWRNVAPLNNDIFDASPTQFHRTGFSRGTSDRIQRVKVIVDSSLAESMDTAHRVNLKDGAVTMFPNGKTMPGPGWYSGANADTEAQGVILHYHARSLSSWLQRYLDGFADNNNHQWGFDINTYFGRWFADTAKTVYQQDRQWLEGIPGFKERLAVVEALLTGKEP